MGHQAACQPDEGCAELDRVYWEIAEEGGNLAACIQIYGSHEQRQQALVKHAVAVYFYHVFHSPEEVFTVVVVSVLQAHRQDVEHVGNRVHDGRVGEGPLLAGEDLGDRFVRDFLEQAFEQGPPFEGLVRAVLIFLLHNCAVERLVEVDHRIGDQTSKEPRCVLYQAELLGEAQITLGFQPPRDHGVAHAVGGEHLEREDGVGVVEAIELEAD
mmetsp:Transcript_34727/g.53309  ORF Transcript_34727/g.53309 Transcript_34727/m.53309 type:complete len:213 (-) Transcript_34727:422-1060(-)